MGKNRYAQPLFGKIIYIYETDLPFEKLSTVFDPSTYWIDVTGLDCEVGYVVDFKEGAGLILIPPEDISVTENEALAAEAKAKLHKLSMDAMLITLAGGNVAIMQSEYQNVITALSDDVALLIPEVYPVWSGDGKEYKKEERVIYNEVMYKVLADHTSQETWTPKDAPSLFAKVIASETEILEWEQPSADNAYKKGNKVKYNGKVYESLLDNNVWCPVDYPEGWREVIL